MKFFGRPGQTHGISSLMGLCIEQRGVVSGMFGTFDDPLVKVTPWRHTLEGDADAPGRRIQLGKLDVSSSFRLFLFTSF